MDLEVGMMLGELPTKRILGNSRIFPQVCFFDSSVVFLTLLFNWCLILCSLKRRSGLFYMVICF